MSAPTQTRMVFFANLAIFDEAALRRAVRARAREDGLSEAQSSSMRSSPSDDLVMLLDPGLIAYAGFEIFRSTCEVRAQ